MIGHMRLTARRLRTCLVLMAWFAQLCLPWAHAAMMAPSSSSMAGWCGNPIQAPQFRAYLADLPAELREGLGDQGSAVHQLDACAKLCAVATTPPPLTAGSVTVALRAAGIEPAPSPWIAPVIDGVPPKPPAQGPPTRV